MPNNDLRVRHFRRFLEVSYRYPSRVAEAYGGDLARAMADSDEAVAATVAAWEESKGLPVRDWRAIGADERREQAMLDWVRSLAPPGTRICGRRDIGIWD